MPGTNLAIGCLVSPIGVTVQRRRIELQLRLVRALYRAESIRRDAQARAIFIERAAPILDSTEAAIGTDDDLRRLLNSVRGEISRGGD
jgi:hypothetical protein